MFGQLRHLLSFSLGVVAGLFSATWVSAVETSVQPTRLLERFCLECHGDEVQEAGVRFDSMVRSLQASDGATLEKIFQVLDSGEMPPENAPSPTSPERSALRAWAQQQLRSLSTTVRSQRSPAMRRLTVSEYNYTMQDLFGVDARFDDLLPDDPISTTGYRNDNQLLGLTTLQLEAYLASARRAVNRYVQLGRTPIKPLRYFIELENLFYSTEARYETLRRAPQPLEDGFRAATRANAVTFVDALGPKVPGAHSDDEAFRPAIPKLNEHYVALPRRLDLGEMIVRIRAAGTADRDGRFPRMRVEAGIALGDGCSVDKRLLGEVDVTVPLAAPRIYLFRVRLEDIPTKGPLRSDDAFDRLSVFDMDHIYISNVASDGRGGFALGSGAYASPSEGSRATADSRQAMAEAEVNFLHLDSIEIEMLPGSGPNSLPYRWSLAREEMPKAADEHAFVADTLARFMTAAFRRPVASKELDVKLDLFRQLREQGFSLTISLRETMAAVLISPSFLFLDANRPRDADSASAQAYVLASRLSYLIWQSPPDEGLLQSAASGTLAQPDVLRRETMRLLDHRKSRRFLKSFCRQWLRLDKLSSVVVNRDVHSRYDEDLATDAVGETLAYFAEVFETGSSALDLIHSDYAMLNARLAEHYGISEITTGAFKRARLPEDSARGGLLTQASVLMMNSDGVDSHPIRRGVWLLDRLLNDPPPPPPPQVPQLDSSAPELRGLSLKQQIELHRQPNSCQSCHQSIDPWGLALEDFDAIGHWRGADGTEDPRETSTRPEPLVTLPDGTHIADSAELTPYLREHWGEQFAHALVHHMLTYALSRPPDFADHREVGEIRRRFKESEYQLQELVLAIVESPLFYERSSP